MNAQSAKRRPTLRDVADQAGLSVTQTSRALNGHSDVAEQTKTRVAKAAAEIGYSPNLAARRLKMPNTGTQSIGLVLDTTSQRFSDPFLGELLAALAEEASNSGFELQLSAPTGLQEKPSSASDDDTSSNVDEQVLAPYRNAIKRNRVDGFVMLRVANDDPRVNYLVDQAVPLVTFGSIKDEHTYPVVRQSDTCCQPAVDHLVKLGHKTIGCINMPPGYGISDRRLRSFHQALAVHELAVLPDHVDGAGFHENVGYEATCRMLETDEPPTAIVAFNDLLAFGALQAAKDQGLSVPTDISIIGFDDVLAARFLSPSLTSMRYSAKDIGHQLIQQLVSAIENHSANSAVVIEPELVIRSSTAPPPSA